MNQEKPQESVTAQLRFERRKRSAVMTFAILVHLNFGMLGNLGHWVTDRVRLRICASVRVLKHEGSL